MDLWLYLMLSHDTGNLVDLWICGWTVECRCWCWVVDGFVLSGLSFMEYVSCGICMLLVYILQFKISFSILPKSNQTESKIFCLFWFGLVWVNNSFCSVWAFKANSSSIFFRLNLVWDRTVQMLTPNQKLIEDIQQIQSGKVSLPNYKENWQSWENKSIIKNKGSKDYIR